MKEGKNSAILLTVIGIATLLVAIVGATFAYFTAQVRYKDTEASRTLTIQAATGGTATFLGGETINVTDIYPKNDKDWVVKTINVTYKNNQTTDNYEYELTLNYDNTFSDDALTYTFAPAVGEVCLSDGRLAASDSECTSTAQSTSNGTLATATSGSLKNTTSQTSRTITLGSGTFVPTTGDTIASHVYVLKIQFPEKVDGENKPVNQNADQGKVLTARVTYGEKRN